MAIPEDAAARDQYEDAFKRFCEIFPDTFVVTERAAMYLTPEKRKKIIAGRLLSAGFHSQMGYFRDDMPLFKLILDRQRQKELDELWNELDYMADVPRRTFQGMMWFERSDSSFIRSTDFDFARAEDRETALGRNLKKLEDCSSPRRSESASERSRSSEPSQQYFDDINYGSRWVGSCDRLAAEPIHIAALQDFAQKAYRRPLTQVRSATTSPRSTGRFARKIISSTKRRCGIRWSAS